MKLLVVLAVFNVLAVALGASVLIVLARSGRKGLRGCGDGDILVTDINSLSGWLDGELCGLDRPDVSSLGWLRDYQDYQRHAGQDGGS
jgi:hypothetical protein